MRDDLLHLSTAARQRLLGLLAVLALILTFTTPAAAASTGVTCTIAGPALTFGTVSPYSGASYTTSGNGTYSCTNTGTTAVTVYSCISIGTGSGGTSPGNRTLALGLSTIPIQITGLSSYPSQIGNGTAFPMAGPQATSVGANATVSGSSTLVATMPVLATAPPPGTYTSSFSYIQLQRRGRAVHLCRARLAARILRRLSVRSTPDRPGELLDLRHSRVAMHDVGDQPGVPNRVRSHQPCDRHRHDLYELQCQRARRGRARQRSDRLQPDHEKDEVGHECDHLRHLP